MEALDVEMSIAAGEQALQALMHVARERAGTLEAHEAEQGICKRLLPMGLAAMQRYVAERGTGDVGPALTRADGVMLPRQTPLRGRDSCSLFGTFAVARTCDRTPGEPGSVPLDAQVNLPERCDSYVLQEWMTWFAVEHPFKESAGWFAPLLDLEVAESVLMEVAQEASEDYERFSAQRPVPPAASAGALLVVSVDGKGVPMMKEEAVTLKAKWGTGEKRQQKKAALVGVSVHGRSQAAVARASVQHSWSSRKRHARAGSSKGARTSAPRAPAGPPARQPGADEAGGDGAASRPTPSAGIPSTANPGSSCSMAPSACGTWRPSCFKPWKRVTCVLDILHVVGSLWSAANALVRGRLHGGQALGAGEADGDSPRPGGRRHRRPATPPHQAAAADSRCGRRSRTSSRASRTTGAGGTTTRTWRRACPSGPASWTLANYTTPIQTTASYPMIGVTGLLNLVAVVDK